VFLGLPYPGPISLWVLTALGYISTASDVWGYEPGIATIKEALVFCSVTARRFQCVNHCKTYEVVVVVVVVLVVVVVADVVLVIQVQVHLVSEQYH